MTLNQMTEAGDRHIAMTGQPRSTVPSFAAAMKFLVSIALLLLVTSCAVTGTKRQATPAAGDYPEPGKGLVIFYRESHFTGGALGYAIRDFDEKPNDVSKVRSQPRIGALPNGSYFVYQATPGQHVFAGSEIDVWKFHGMTRFEERHEFGVGSREDHYHHDYCRVSIESNTTYYVRADRLGIAGVANPSLHVVGSPQGSEAIKSLKRVTLSK